MKKTFIIAVSVLLSPLCAHADGYTWNGGGTITTEKWGTQGNWTLDSGILWNSTGNGPGTTNSNMWEDITVKDAKGAIDSLEGWDLDLTLKNAELTINTLVKFQTTGSEFCELNIDETSKLTIGQFGGGTMGNHVAVVNHGQLEINLNKAMVSFTFDLGGTGVVTINGDHDLNITSLTANLLATPSSSFTLTSGEGYTAMTRTLMTLSDTARGDFDVAGTGTTISNTGELVRGTTRTNTAADIGKYFVEYNGTTKAITLTYVVPEPTTATLSLLALAGLAARRRR